MNCITCRPACVAALLVSRISPERLLPRHWSRHWENNDHVRAYGNPGGHRGTPSVTTHPMLKARIIPGLPGCRQDVRRDESLLGRQCPPMRPPSTGWPGSAAFPSTQQWQSA
jgi:hypothetical protein